MPTFKDWERYRTAHPDVGRPPLTPTNPVATAQLTETARTVVTHPGWQLFLDRLVARRRDLAAKRTALEREMLAGIAFGDALAVFKIAIRELQGEINGLDFAASIVPDMIQAGEELARQFKGEPSGVAIP